MDIDRISELPDSVLHRILSLLPTSEVVRTSVLSRRWNWVFDSFPFWDFNKKYFGRHYQGAFREEVITRRCVEFAHRSLGRRLTRNGLGIPRINLYLSNCPRLHGLLSDFINMAIDGRVKDLTLHINHPLYHYAESSQIFFAPQSVFTSRSLTVLDLCGCIVYESVLEHGVGNCTLRRLSLSNVKVSNKGLRLLFNCFPFVEVLTIKKLHPVQCVSVAELPKLKVLDVSHFRVEIDAPSLRRLRLHCAFVCGDIFGNIAAKFPLMEELTLIKPTGWHRLRIPGFLNADRLNLDNGADTGRMDVVGSHLRYFHSTCTLTGQSSTMLEVNACEALKEMEVSGFSEDSDQLSRGLKVSRFSLLEKLRITRCLALEKIKVSSPRLKSIYIDDCPNIEDIRIEAPQLLLFEYVSHRAPLSFFVHVPCLLDFVLKPASKASWDDSFFLRLNSLLSQLDRTAEIKLSIESRKAFSAVDIPGLRRRCVSSSRNLAKLRIAVGGRKCSDLSSLIDALLWSCQPRSLWICSIFYKQFAKVLYDKIAGHNIWNVEMKAIALSSNHGKMRSWNLDAEREPLLQPEAFAGLLRKFRRGEAHFRLHWPDPAGKSGLTKMAIPLRRFQ